MVDAVAVRRRERAARGAPATGAVVQRLFERVLHAELDGRVERRELLLEAHSIISASSASLLPPTSTLL